MISKIWKRHDAHSENLKLSSLGIVLFHSSAFHRCVARTEQIRHGGHHRPLLCTGGRELVLLLQLPLELGDLAFLEPLVLLH